MRKHRRSCAQMPRVDEHEACTEITADPDTVYAVVSDVTATARHSPECRRIEWLSGHSTAVPGARFRGRNRWRGYTWWREARVTDAQPPERFVFETVPAGGINNSRTVWTYELTSPRPGVTTVKQRFVFYAPRWIAWMDTVLGRPGALRRNVDASLRAVKQLAETAQPARSVSSGRTSTQTLRL